MDSENIPVIELFVKTSSLDKINISGETAQSQYFMCFHILDQRNRVVLKEVITINPDSLPKDFIDLDIGHSLPAVKVVSGRSMRGEDLSGLLLSHTDEIDSFIDSLACPNMRTAKHCPDEAEAEKMFLHLQTKFNIFMRDPNNDASSLMMILKRVDSWLESQGTKFMLDDELSFADCLLLPRLHHVRVAGKQYKDFEFPEHELPNIIEYLRNAYQEDVFKQSCPADEDIIVHYSRKASNTPIVNPRTRQSRTFSFDFTQLVQ